MHLTAARLFVGWTAVCIGALGALGLAPASAQSLSPMREEIVSFADRFALQLTVGNPNDRATTLAVRVFDLDWNELTDVWVSRPLANVAPGGRIPVLVIAPFHDEVTREVRICAETAPSPVVAASSGARIRGQVCGRYHARRVS